MKYIQLIFPGISKYLGIKHFSRGDGVDGAAEDESWRHVAVVDAFDLDLDVLARGDRSDLDVIRPDLLHLDVGLHIRQGVSLCDN